MKTYSRLTTKLLTTAVAGCSCFLFLASIRAEPSSEVEYNKRYRSFYDVPLGDNYTGRSPFMRAEQRGEQPPPPPPPQRRAEVREQPRPEPVRQSCTDPTTGLIRMGKTMPPEVSLGQEFMYQLNPTALACAGNVVITDRIPPGTTYVRSEPAAQVKGDQLVWNIGDMEAGETRDIKVWLKAEQEGRLASCATVSADPRTCASTFVGKPVLAITKTGPEVAQLGSDVTYNIVVRNTGTAVAKGVVVNDTIPEGLTHSSGRRELAFEVGDLAPNQSRAIPVTVRADKRGKVCNGAQVVSANAGNAKAEACTTIVQPGLKIVKTAVDNQVLINRVASYNIVVSNTGDVPLTGVVVTDTAAAETTITAAEGGTVAGNVARWQLGELKAGEEKKLAVKIASKVPGRFCNTAAVASAQGLQDSSQACTEWIGVTGVLVEVVDDPDPIQVGETTTFTIRVTNQGSTRDIQDVSVKSSFGQEMSPASASAGGTVSGQNVTWPVVARLAPKQSLTYTVVGKAVKAGDHRMETQVTTRERTAPIVELESTTVY